MHIYLYIKSAFSVQEAYRSRKQRAFNQERKGAFYNRGL